MSRHPAARRAWTAGWTVAAVTLVPLVTGEPATSASTALPRTTLTADARDLGTLGGTRSTANDVDGTVVVGSSLLADGLTSHAFAYDLHGSTMRDLGTLGGRNSNAVDIDGTVVTGTSDTDGQRHAFAYDLATSTMHDVGSLVPGGVSEASGVDDGVVVGQSGPRAGHGNAFAYDVASGTLRDLGDLGLGDSRAIDVDRGTVLVEAWSTTTWQRQAFAYDLGTSTVRLLTSVPHTGGVPVALSGSVAVGNAPRPAAFAYDFATSTGRDLPGPHARVPTVAAVDGTQAAGFVNGVFSSYLVAWDLAAAAPVGRDRGSLGGNGVGVSALRDGVVVGTANRAGDGRPRAVALDLHASRPWLTDLGTVGGTAGDAVAVSGRTVVGWSSTARHHLHATAWTLRTTSAPSFRFARPQSVVQESVGKARFTVLRDGSAARAASVTYVVRRPWSGGQVLATGILRFAAGRTSRTLLVPILDDTRREAYDRWAVVLRSPSAGAVLGTPNTGLLVVRKSDQRPDAWISTSALSSYAGNNVYNSTGARQTRTLSAQRGRTRTFHVRVYNDGNIQNDFVVRGSAARPGSTVRYFYEGNDVTRALRSANGWRVQLLRGSHVSLEVRVTPTGSASIGSLKPAAVRATWRGDGDRVDAVRGLVKVVR